MKRTLWLRLRQYHFDNLVPPQLWDHVRSAFGGVDSSTQAFASKIARKLGWERQFALRAIEEYRKFVYLGIVAEFDVTPPKIIDQVWHEHLLFSRAYREFCRDVLQHDFDHNPELLPSDGQTGLFQLQYAATLELYRVEFNMRPPVDIWGQPKFRVTVLQPAAELPRGSQYSDNDSASVFFGALPLYQQFDGSESTPHHHHMTEFGGGGGFAGGGGGDSWSTSDSHNSSHHSSHDSSSSSTDSSFSSSNSDSGSSDSGSSGDSGGSSGSDSGGSSCGSSGCSSGSSSSD